MTARDQGPAPEDIDVITHNGSRMYATAAALVGYVPELDCPHGCPPNGLPYMPTCDCWTNCEPRKTTP